MNCQEVSSVCTIGKHKCAEDSECSVRQNGSYFCICPLGKSGVYCDEGKNKSCEFKMTHQASCIVVTIFFGRTDITD